MIGTYVYSRIFNSVDLCAYARTRYYAIGTNVSELVARASFITVERFIRYNRVRVEFGNQITRDRIVARTHANLARREIVTIEVGIRTIRLVVRAFRHRHERFNV